MWMQCKVITSAILNVSLSLEYPFLSSVEENKAVKLFTSILWKKTHKFTQELLWAHNKMEETK